MTDRLNELVACMPDDARRTFAAIAGRIVSEHAVPDVFHDVAADDDEFDAEGPA